MRISAKCGLGVGDVWLLLDKSGKQEVKQCTHINCVKLPLSQFLVLTNAQIFLHNTAPGNGGFQSTGGTMQDYLENAYRKAQEMELENVRFHSEMQRFEFINKAISNALLIYAGCHAVLACSAVSINQPSTNHQPTINQPSTNHQANWGTIMRMTRQEAERRRAEYERRYNQLISLAKFMAEQSIEIISDSISSSISSSSSCSDSYSSSSSFDSSSCSSD